MSTIWPGAVATQASEPGFTAVTRTNVQSGPLNSHIKAGPRMANAAAIRASAHVRVDGPLRSSAMK